MLTNHVAIIHSGLSLCDFGPAEEGYPLRCDTTSYVGLDITDHGPISLWLSQLKDSQLWRRCVAPDLCQSRLTVFWGPLSLLSAGWRETDGAQD
jgi:hypothetical protein